MLAESVTAVMIASLALGQTPISATPMPTPAAQSAPAQSAPTSGQVSPAPGGQALPAPTGQTITVPAGTAIQLTLMSAVKSKSTKAGDSVRAEVAFPVTIGTQLAIPAGTFVDGTVVRVTPHPGGGQPPSFLAHFTRLVFSNGYSIALNGENTQALLLPPNDSLSANEVAELVPPRLPGMHLAMGEGQVGLPPTQAPPPPHVGPPMGLIIGISLGGTAALVILAVAGAHHHANSTDFMLYAAGWQFQMVLDSPVTLDAAQVLAAAATPSTN
ncbi:MAG TPA: hypothetical protein VMT38_10580 [Terracidiphilus sp.]|nr:hypothetical protein [Terracidiphilus sp.]